jgi:hypothetical protein
VSLEREYGHDGVTAFRLFGRRSWKSNGFRKIEATVRALATCLGRPMTLMKRLAIGADLLRYTNRFP